MATAKFTFNRNGGEGTIAIKGKPAFVREAVCVLTAWAATREVEAEVAKGRPREAVVKELMASIDVQAKALGLPLN